MTKAENALRAAAKVARQAYESFNDGFKTRSGHYQRCTQGYSGYSDYCLGCIFENICMVSNSVLKMVLNFFSSKHNGMVHGFQWCCQ